MTEIRKTTPADIDILMPIFNEARATIAALGIDQWQNGYPNRDVIFADVEKAQSFSVLSDSEIIGTFALICGGEPTYDKIIDGKWLTGDGKDHYFAIHRVAISVKSRGKGISTAIIDYCTDKARNSGKESLRIDTHSGNVVMRKMLEKHGFVHCGTIYLENGDPRDAYHKAN